MKKNSLLASVVLALAVAGLIGFYLLRDRTLGPAADASASGSRRVPATGAPAATRPADVLQGGTSEGSIGQAKASTRIDTSAPAANREEVAPAANETGDGSSTKGKIPTTDELAKKYERMNTEDLKRTFEALAQLLEDQRAKMSADEIEAFQVEMEWVKAKGSQP